LAIFKKKIELFIGNLKKKLIMNKKIIFATQNASFTLALALQLLFQEKNI